jgi:phosphatidylserine decarboxylase
MNSTPNRNPFVEKTLPVAKEGIPMILLISALTIALWCAAAVTNVAFLLWVAVFLTAITACIVFLFRNPLRTLPALHEHDIVSPADGKIINVDTIDEAEVLKNKALRVSIFLSLLDVHVNWIPVSGVVIHKQRSEGKFLPAFTKAAGERNERVSIGIKCDDGFKMKVVQIAGFIARRIRCGIDPGQNVQRGQQYGMIYLGSRVDIVVPRESKIMVRKGDCVQGGITVIAQKK